MSVAEPPPVENTCPQWDWRSDAAFLERLLCDLRQQATLRIRSGIRAISVSSLVQESLIKILDADCLRDPADRRYIYALAARSMRFVIVDHVRAQQTLKRGEGRTKTNMDLLTGAVESNHLDILAIHEALEVLGQRHARQAQVVEMKFFAGCTMPEIAEHLGYGLSTVEHDWKEAKAFLIDFLSR
jgi:RNA polymerase sigma factor (TIGR02999 family)